MDAGFELVEKEEVSGFHFPKEEVLTREADVKELDVQLKRAIALGNLEHQKVKIYFKDEEGFKVVHTTIWGITDKSILLKQNVILPKNRIIKLEI